MYTIKKVMLFDVTCFSRICRSNGCHFKRSFDTFIVPHIQTCRGPERGLQSCWCRRHCLQRSWMWNYGRLHRGNGNWGFASHHWRSSPGADNCVGSSLLSTGLRWRPRFSILIILRPWCKIIVTTLFNKTRYNSFALSPRFEKCSWLLHCKKYFKYMVKSFNFISFNFMYILGRTIHEFKLEKKCWFYFIVVCFGLIIL